MNAARLSLAALSLPLLLALALSPAPASAQAGTPGSLQPVEGTLVTQHDSEHDSELDSELDSQPRRSRREDEVGVRATVEAGFLAVPAHTIQVGLEGSVIDYPGDGDQKNLYFVPRLSVELDIWRQHIITFLYQPLDLVSETTLRRDLVIDDVLFPAGTPTRFRYGFPFYRVGWAFDVLEARNQELAFGVGFQIRNASISFESTDGRLFRERSGIGPVPLLRARGRFPIYESLFFAFEIDGFYAPISVFNGSDNDVEGAILDASVRMGWHPMDHLDAFVNVRYLAGGASGQSDPEFATDGTRINDGWQSNWLHFLVFSVGVTIDSRPN